MAEEEQQQRRMEDDKEEERTYKTKVVQFLGRSTPIVLQNDNGPCPLLAICNVLLLRNAINLNPDASEVSLDKLLSLVAGRLIDSNSNFADKDDGYVNNQLKNIDDAIDLLSKLATGIDVNVQFRKIDDFEYTSECAIFDLMDIGLYHGWIVDPQDTETATAIGSKSYNTLVGELVALKAMEEEDKSTYEEDCVDFAAATTATLGVPSPCLSRGMSFDDPPTSVQNEQRRRGDLEEEEELIRALNLSQTESTSIHNESASPDINWGHVLTSSGEGLPPKNSSPAVFENSVQLHLVNENEQKFDQPDLLASEEHDTLQSGDALELRSGNAIASSMEVEPTQPCSKDSPDSESLDPVNNLETEKSPQMQNMPFSFSGSDTSAVIYTNQCNTAGSGERESISENNSTFQVHDISEVTVYRGSAVVHQDFQSSDGEREHVDVHEGLDEDVSLSLDSSEPIYEGEECILDSGVTTYENREPIYEGEMVLAEQADKGAEGDTCASSNNIGKQQFHQPISAKEGQLIQNFLENNASQLTFYGLFCLQEGIKERQLCVFFRNNHFSTMFKFNGELYLLATDQGYINQPELVWEKLNEVNGDTVFMTGDFREFKAESQGNGSWDEQTAMTHTADYLASMESAVPEGSSIISDLQLAIALQQQEFGQQPQHPQPRPPQQTAVVGPSRLITGPQAPRSGARPPRPEGKTKEKCQIM
ncbi:hypothetical protein QJS10_CPA01g02405 [Acorus calamus]|uniref:MINDY deubiquitinase domain-containing protein n=1 Tax=Acorus calamus TaxID=4465 RepID=A0AAV9FML5_ACOCL|nr:hypothetical protein QJS10_CPA01g02405 [Acorus calamus]